MRMLGLMFAAIIVSGNVLGIAGAQAMRRVTPAELAKRDTPPPAYPIMQMDVNTLRARKMAFGKLPLADAKAVGGPLPPSVNLLPHFDYVPEEHDQGYCGNCWIWASAAVVQMELSTQFGVMERLSMQHATSCFDGRFACHGGLPQEYAALVNRMGFVVPWNNPNAFYQQFDAEDYNNGRPAVPCAAIADAPRHLIHYCGTQRIEAAHLESGGPMVDSAPLVEHIKAQLNAGHALVITLYFPTSETVDQFRTFWVDYGENAYLDISEWDGLVWEPEVAGGHAMTVVGYTEEAWIVLNSWGTNQGLRPNGLLAFGPVDSMKYDATFTMSGDAYRLMDMYRHAVAYGGLDSDGDGFSDADELLAGTDPHDFTDTPAVPLGWAGLALVLALAGASRLRHR